MPYRADLRDLGDGALDCLIELGALDVERDAHGAIAALLPDSVTARQLAAALGIRVRDIAISPAVGRDDCSVWVLGPRPISVGRLRIVPAQMAAGPDTLRLVDAPAFGTGLHATTSLCLDELARIAAAEVPRAALDVGTGSGILALAALCMGVPRAAAIDTDGAALQAAAENARLNGLDGRLQLMPGGPGSIEGTWPLVLANVVAGALIEMAPALVRRISHHGQLVLSGIASAVEPDVDRVYRRLGMRRVRSTARGGWVALVLQTSW